MTSNLIEKTVIVTSLLAACPLFFLDKANVWPSTICLAQTQNGGQDSQEKELTGSANILGQTRVSSGLLSRKFCYAIRWRGTNAYKFEKILFYQ